MKSTYAQIYDLLSASKRRSALVLLILILIGAMFEVLGIGLLLPVIVLLTDDNLASRYPQVQPLLNALDNPSHEVQVKIALALLVAVYFCKNFYLAFLSWWKARFSIGWQVEFSQRLFTLYLRQPYNFHLQRNSAQLIRNITGEVAQFINNAVNPILMLVAEVILLLGILAMLLAVEPVGSMTVCLVMSTAAWLFYRSTRIRISRWGEKRQYHDGQRIQHLQQGLGGVKDVKLLGRESDFLTTFHEHNIKSGQISQFMEILQKLPRLWLELLAVIGFAMLVSIMLAQARPMADIVPTIGLFVAAAFRLLPSLARILNAAQKLRFGRPSVERLYEDFQLSEAEHVDEPKPVFQGERFAHEIDLVGVKYRYPGAHEPAINDISFKIKQGESVGFIGPSGSGKTTLVDIILGLLAPDEGQVTVDGSNIHDKIREWQDQIGYVPQAIYLTDDSLRRNVAFGLSEEDIDDAAVERAIKAAQLEEFVSNLPERMETVVGERGVRLSGGQRQRIGIARALYHDPGVLILDEATSALDTATEQDVMAAVNALHGSKTVIIVAHRLSTVENCDSLCRLDKGRVASVGTPHELLKVSGK